MKILVCRTDKAGDIILTSPVFKALADQYAGAEIYALTAPYTSSIVKMIPEVKGIILNSLNGKNKTALELAAELKSYKFDKAIIVHPSFQAIIATFLARIPIRTGRASNIWQFFLSKRCVQKRSKNLKHEYEYNLDLADVALEKSRLLKPKLYPSKKAIDNGMEAIKKAGLEGTNPIIIHPGHGGSAHNITPEQYSELTRQLIDNQIPVILSFGPGEEHLKSFFPKTRQGVIGYLSGLPDFESLAGAFWHCSGFVGGSTGPMHLAGAIGLPVLGFFPPQKSMTPVRWGPANQPSKVILPEISDCKGICDTCNQNPCMKTIKVKEAFEWLKNNRLIK